MDVGEAGAVRDGPTAGVPGRSDPELRVALWDLAVRPLWALFLAASVPFLLGLELPLWAQYVPLVASGVVLGMPHGAVDHLVPARLAGGSPLRSALVVTGVYAALGGAYLGAWFVAPVPAAVGFVLLTWLHWGQGDVYLLSAATGGVYPRSRPHALAVLLVRGAMPMAVTLVAAPDQYRRVLSDFVGLFGTDPGAVEGLVSPGVVTAVGGLVAGLAALALLRGAFVRRDGAYRRRLDRGFRTDLAETLVLTVFFLSVPPILAVGLYFCLWHSLRHVARLVVVDDPGAAALREGRTAAALKRFARDAAPLTAVALALLAVVYPLVPDAPSGLGEGVALYLVLIAVLTLPHVAVVTWMDHRQGVWRSGSGSGADG